MIIKCKNVILIFVLAAMVLFSGCGRKDTAGDANEMVLHSALNAKIEGLDPATSTSLYAVIIGSQIFENLYQYHFLIL